MPDRQIITVAELSTYIKELLDGNALLKNVLVRGEISNYRPNTSGHMYFSLKDDAALIRCVMFKGAASKLRFRPENGMNVIVTGTVSSFVRDGQYQLYLTEMTPDGVGELFIAFEQLKARLAGEGLFELSHKKPMPRYPKKIALVTSPTGAAIRDMLRILKKRFPTAKVLVVPVKVQGEGAADEIAAAIRLVNEKNAADLIIAGRGGGSAEDLWCFNEECVARAVYASRIPVISAVGHEPDFTIIDFVADLRAATPSNAAELAVPDAAELLARLSETSARIMRLTTSSIQRGADKLEALASKKALISPENIIDQKRMLLDFYTKHLSAAGAATFAECDKRLASAAAGLDAMSPLKVLSRGYSIATDEGGAAVTDASSLSPGDRLGIRFHTGSAECRVLKTAE